MKQLITDFRDDSFAFLQRQYAINRQPVSERPWDMDKVTLMCACLFSKRVHEAGLTVTDDRRVVSDCVFLVKRISYLIPSSVDRDIKD